MRKGRWHRPVLFAITRVVLPLVLLVAIGVGMIYVRLLNGPLSLKPLAHPIAAAIAADVPGMDVTIEDVSVALTPGRGVEFRLRNVKLLDSRGSIVGAAPDAAVTISSAALWTGRITPSRIILIEPSLHLQHTREGGLTVSIGSPGETTQRAQPRVSASISSDPGAAIVAVVASLGRSAGFVKGLGLRDATFTIESEGQRAVWRIREADVGVDRQRDGSAVGANFLVDGQRGSWRMSLLAKRNDGDGALTIESRIAGLNPAAMSQGSPLLASLSPLDLPLSGFASVKIGEQGDIRSGEIDLEVGRGAFAPGLRGNGKLAIDGGRVKLSFDPAARTVTLHPSRIESGKGWVTIAGTAKAAPGATAPWQIALDSVDGSLISEEFGLAARPLEALRVRAAYDPVGGNLDIAEAMVKAAGGEVALSGIVPPRGAATKLNLQGRISPMSAETAKLLWPSFIAPGARAWCGRQVQQGRVASGTFIVEDVGHGFDRGRAAGDGIRVGVSLEGANVRIQPRPGFAPVEAPRVLVRLEGQTLDIAAPDATIITGPQRRLPLKGVRMVTNEVSSPIAMGDLTFRAQGPLPPAIDIAEQQAARNGRAFVLPGEGIEGRVDAQARIAVPLGEDVHAEDTRIDIRGRITDGRLKNVLGSYDVNGASLTVDVTDQQLELKGDLLLGGVASKLALRRIFAATDAEQPPILLTANLDTADRAQLGLDVNDFIVGEMPIELLISPRTGGDSQVQLRANLTNAELLIEPLAWKKAPGRPATLQLEIVRPQKGRTELQGFRIVGEDISLNGSLVLDARNRVREFHFPELVLHVVSRLQLSGALRSDNVWDVSVRGSTLDGREMFRSFYALDQLRNKPAAPRKDQAGIDLKAEIDNVLGHHDLALRTVRLQLSNRGGKTVAMTARGIVESSTREAGRPLDVAISQAPREARRLTARSEDAGQAFRMIGFFANMLGGSMQLDMNLDGAGNAERTGQLIVRNFAILGDPVGETPEPASSRSRSAPRPVQARSRLDFDSMNARFELGHGQVVISNADLRGQVLGVVLSGKADFRAQQVHLEGTYVPLQGLNSAIGSFPILGQILAGPRGEGVIGMKFDVKGPMSRPEIAVNPVSIVPGILREMMKISNPDLRITPRDAAPASPAPKQSPPKVLAVRSSTTGDAAKKASPSNPKPSIDPDGGWSSNTVVPPAPQSVKRQQ